MVVKVEGVDEVLSPDEIKEAVRPPQRTPEEEALLQARLARIVLMSRREIALRMAVKLKDKMGNQWGPEAAEEMAKKMEAWLADHSGGEMILEHTIALHPPGHTPDQMLDRATRLYEWVNGK